MKGIGSRRIQHSPHSFVFRVPRKPNGLKKVGCFEGHRLALYLRRRHTLRSSYAHLRGYPEGGVFLRNATPSASPTATTTRNTQHVNRGSYVYFCNAHGSVWSKASTRFDTEWRCFCRTLHLNGIYWDTWRLGLLLLRFIIQF